MGPTVLLVVGVLGAAILLARGSEDNYAQAHGEFGIEIKQVGPRSMISFTTDVQTAKVFAGPSGQVYFAILGKNEGIVQSLPGAGESEILVRNMIRVRPWSAGGGASGGE